MTLFRFAAFGLLCYNAGGDAVRASVSTLMVWLIVELSIVATRHTRRERRPWAHEPLVLVPRPFDQARD